MTFAEDKEYRKIVNKFLKNNRIVQMIYIEHHGISRLEHSLKVSYKSYVIAKKLNLDYKKVAIGGLLHDFYLDGNERNNYHRFIDTFIHPKKH